MGDSQYSFSLTTFSPTGKLVQIEHALTAVGSGQTSLGIKGCCNSFFFLFLLVSKILCCYWVLRYDVVDRFFFCVVAANGVVIATEKKLPSILVDESSVSKLIMIF